jgi:predicted HTH domain antitoxin
MAISFQIPDSIEEHLRREIPDLEGAAKQAFAIDAYREGKLSLGQLAGILGISSYEADGLLKQRGIMLDISAREVEQEVAALRDLLRR